MDFLRGVNRRIGVARKNCAIEESAEKFLSETLRALEKMSDKRAANIKELIFYMNDENICVNEAENHLNIYIQKCTQYSVDIFNTIKSKLKSEKATVKSEDEKKIVISIILLD